MKNSEVSEEVQEALDNIGINLRDVEKTYKKQIENLSDVEISILTLRYIEEFYTTMALAQMQNSIKKNKSKS